MKKQWIIILLLCLITMSCTKKPTSPDTADTRDVLERLADLEGVTVIEITPGNGYARQFQIDFEQPVDHANPAGQTFLQRAYLSHSDTADPVILAASGYTSRASYTSELSEIMTANQLQVTHRYMAGARPSPLDWQYLTIEQAAADIHHICRLIKQVYSRTWISFGGSKNGMTVLFHRRFYPDDVTATVALYAPLPQGIDDPRFDLFLGQVGSEADRQKIKRYQRATLKARDEILPMIRNYLNNSGFTYTLDEGLILDYEICEFPFAFWQLEDGDVSVIPDSGATAAGLYAYLERWNGFPLYSEEYIDFLEPVYYQAYTEFGWYRLVDDHLADLIQTVPAPSYSFFAPHDVPLVFKPEVMPDIISWLQTEGDNIIYIYGDQDPWTAAAIELTGQTNALKFVQPGANHQLRIADIDERQAVYDAIESWTGIPVSGAATGPGTAVESERRLMRPRSPVR